MEGVCVYTQHSNVEVNIHPRRAVLPCRIAVPYCRAVLPCRIAVPYCRIAVLPVLPYCRIARIARIAVPSRTHIEHHRAERLLLRDFGGDA